MVDSLKLLQRSKVTAVLDLLVDATLLAETLSGGSTAGGSALVESPRLQRTSALGEGATMPGSEGIASKNLALDLGVVVVLARVGDNESGSRNGGNGRKTDHFE